jgi:predicted oxidoreductase
LVHPDEAIIKKEFALSGSEQNPDLTGKDIPLLLKRLGKNPPGPVQAFMDKGADFVVRNDLGDLVSAMNTLTEEALLDVEQVRAAVEARDREIDNAFSKDAQVTAIRGARAYLGDKLMRTARPHRLLDPKAGPLIAVRLNILTRKTLGGLQTDLSGRVLELSGKPVPGLYGAGEVAGFGGGGVHGYNAGRHLPRWLPVFGAHRGQGGRRLRASTASMSINPSGYWRLRRPASTWQARL